VIYLSMYRGTVVVCWCTACCTSQSVS